MRVVQSPTLTAHAQDDGFHEIQLNGKQLVFLFMAATVVSVVIFLCGVLVGRGVRSAQDIESQSAARSAEPTADLLPGPPATPQSMSGSSATPSATPGGRDGEGPVTTTISTPGCRDRRTAARSACCSPWGRAKRRCGEPASTASGRDA